MLQGVLNSSLLRYRPPAQTSPETWEVTAGAGFQTHGFGAGNDGIVKLPATTRERGITITSGRNIRIIGGAIKLVNKTETSIRCSGISGSLFIEGVYIDNNGAERDAIDAGGSEASGFNPDIYLQNMRVEGVAGQVESENHGDVYQPQNPIGTLYVDKMTALSEYQCFFLANSKHITAVKMSRLNTGPHFITGEYTGGYQIWFSTEVSNTYPVTLEDVWVKPKAAEYSVVFHTVMPDNTKAIAPTSSDGNETAKWPAGAQITGAIHKGPPPLGDFVKAAEIGLSYVSPGYR